MTLVKKIVFLLACATASAAYAVVASPEPFEYTRADGTTVMARVYGDEFHSYIMSLDGELLAGDTRAETVEEAAMQRRIHRANQATKGGNFPTVGSPRSLVLLVSFTDLEFGETLQGFRDLLNQSGYSHNDATGSCRDYYIASSDSLFSPYFDCYGVYQLAHDMAYYGANSSKGYDVRPYMMVAEACQMAHADGVNFKNYDTDNDGILDNVFVFYAGHNEAEGAKAETIWPHQSDISSLNIRLDGVLLASYACTSEYRGPNGSTRCGIGTFCHEFGHVIGLPDFYDTGYNYYTVSNWDVMCSGSYNNNGRTPPTFSAYERMYEGWLTPQQLEIPGQYALTAIPFQKEAYLIAESTHNLSGKQPNPKEFFLLENRSEEDVWDAYLPGHGMLVWHIDYNASAWANNTPNNGPTLMRMHMEEANGVTWKSRRNGESGRASDPYPGTANVMSFTPYLHNGTQMAQPIFNIHEKDHTIFFTYIGEIGASLKASVEEVDITTTVDKSRIVDWQPEAFELIGEGIDPEKEITLQANSNRFLLYAGAEAPSRGSNEWQRAITVSAEADSTVQQTIWVNFEPKEQSCDETKAILNIISSAAVITMPLVGHSPRPTYVHTPQIYDTRDITPYSFVARWEGIDDAEYYYITLYQTEEGKTDFVQSFEDFNDFDKIREAGWWSNTNLTTTSDKADGSRALYLKNHGDQVVSETYPSAVTHLHFWLNAFAATVDTVGVLELEGRSGTEWMPLDRLVVTKTSKRLVTHYDIDAEQDIRAFRVTWIDNGGVGIGFDAFTATTSQKINYIYKGRELSLDGFVYGDSVSFIFKDLTPASRYYYQVQCTDMDKGCTEHLTELSAPVLVTTMDGKPVDGRQLTIAYDSINYNPAQHAIYVNNPQSGDYLYFYKPDGQIVSMMSLHYGVYIYPLEMHRFKKGEYYLVQYATKGRLGRQNKWVKFLFR